MQEDQVQTETVEETEGSFFTKWVKPHLWMTLGILGIVAALLMLLPIIEVKADFAINGIDVVEDSYLYLWDILGGVAFSSGALITLILFIFGAIFGFLIKINKVFAILSIFSYLIGACCCLCLADFFGVVVVNATGSSPELQASVGVVLPCILGFVASIIGISVNDQLEPFTVQDIAEIGILTAVAVICDMYLAFDISAGAGSINLAMIPLFLIALRCGPMKGFIAGGLIFGLITCLTDGYGFATYPFDYLIGFGSIGILGLFKNLIFKKDGPLVTPLGFVFILVGGVAATLVRFIGSSASSMVIYGYSLADAAAYNTLYILPTGAIATGAMLLLYYPLARVNARFKSHK